MAERSENRRGGLIVAWAVSGLSLYLTSLILGSRMGFEGFWSIALTALAVGLLNFLLGPLLCLITCPLIILTLGLARFLVSGLILMMAARWMPGFHLASFWWAVLAAMIIAVLNGALERMFGVR